jgi:hypothetical protein
MARVRFLDQVPVGFYEVGNGGGGGGTPGDPIGSIQFNNAGVFGGSSNLIWNNSINTITLNGSLNNGNGNAASGLYSHAEGTATNADGQASHAEGNSTIAAGLGSHAEGNITLANGAYSHTEGVNTIAYGGASHAEGQGTITSGSYQHVQGIFNRTSSLGGAFILGNGTSDANRSNLIFAAGNTVQITGSLSVSGSITGSLQGTASFATTATQIQSGSIIASISPSSNVFTINSGSTNLVYVSASNGNMGVSGYVTASALYANSGTINGLTSTNFNTLNANVGALLSFDSMTSLKSFITIAGSGSFADLIAYSSNEYYGVVIDGIAYDTPTDNSLIFRCTVANTATKVGKPEVAVLSSTEDTYSSTFLNGVKFGATNEGTLVRVNVTNYSPKPVNIRPMYRLVKQCQTI